jgi:hypothetical protein
MAVTAFNLGVDPYAGSVALFKDKIAASLKLGSDLRLKFLPSR